MIDSKFSILFVEDEQPIFDWFGTLLQEAGYFAVYCPDGVSGLRIFQERSWDVVITDRVMPGMTGEQFAREIKSISPSTPVILITGNLPRDMHLEFFDDVLTKPFSIEILLESVRKAIHSSKE